MKTPKTRHYPCCFTLESNPGFPLPGFFAPPENFISILWHHPNAVSSMVQLKRHNSGIKMEHFNQCIDSERVGMAIKQAEGQMTANFVPKGWGLGTKPGVWEQFILPLVNCRIG